jgi:NADH-quinone oxidoreductase subunit C
MRTDEMASRLGERFPDLLEARGELTVLASAEDLLAALEYLRGDEDLSFGFLSDVSCTDWPGSEPRFWIVYHLLSMERGHRIRMKVGLPEGQPIVPSVTGLYPTADWLEREVYDFFGVIFEGHPDLRRIEMPEDWVGHPLRKDHPLGGVPTAYKGAFVPPPDQRGL